MAAKTEFGVNGQIVRKLSTDSIAVGLMVPSPEIYGVYMASKRLISLLAINLR